MGWRKRQGKFGNFIERFNEFLNAEIPEYAFTTDTIYFCHQCDVCIPKDIYEKNEGVCSKCFKTLR